MNNRVEDTLNEDYEAYVEATEALGLTPMSFREWYRYQEEEALWNSEDNHE